MDDNNSNSQEAILPTFSSLRAAHQLATRSYAAGCLHWTLSDPLSLSMFVMPDSHNPDPATLVPYYNNANTDDPSSPTLNPLAQKLVTRPAVRSIRVNIDQLSHWEHDWKDMHIEHCGPTSEQRQTVVVATRAEGDVWDADGNRVRLVVCCGERRPGPSEPLEVQASDPTRGVTVDDYVRAVHPWLMEKRDEIVAARRMLEGIVEERMDEGTVLMVNVNAPAALVIETKENWLAQCRLNTA